MAEDCVQSDSKFAQHLEGAGVRGLPGRRGLELVGLPGRLRGVQGEVVVVAPYREPQAQVPDVDLAVAAKALAIGLQLGVRNAVETLPDPTVFRTHMPAFP